MVICVGIFSIFTLHLQNCNLFPDVSTSTSFLDLNSEVFFFSVHTPIPTLVVNPIFNFSLDAITFASNPFIQIMAYGFEVVKGTNCESLIRELILKSRFFEINDKKMENINKGD
jgi:hypothetical protein